MASARGLTAVGVPPFPSWIFYIRIAILVLSLVLLGVAAWAVSLFTGGGSAAYGYTGSSGMMVFVVCDSLWRSKLVQELTDGFFRPYGVL